MPRVIRPEPVVEVAFDSVRCGLDGPAGPARAVRPGRAPPAGLERRRGRCCLLCKGVGHPKA
ncbi:hypothetical protein KPATCC21470_0763 [Kitasatospora purpeofusca]